MELQHLHQSYQLAYIDILPITVIGYRPVTMPKKLTGKLLRHTLLLQPRGRIVPDTMELRQSVGLAETPKPFAELMCINAQMG